MTIPLTGQEALSGIFGSISLASWIFLLVPQLLENYSQGSADGISLTFLLIWFVGDITNLIGALWAGLVPTVIALAIYFCIADTVLILQVLYYKRRNRDAAAAVKGADVPPSEIAPLLTNPSAPRPHRHSLTDVTDANVGLPGSRRRSSAARTHSSHTVVDPLHDEPRPMNPWLKNTVSIVLIVLAGAAGWGLAWRAGAWRPSPVGGAVAATPVGAEILGYASAVCYLGARIPQILKNQRERSCDGLALLFFLLSLLGNATYGAGILFHSTERQYFLTNLPWLIGSLGTMAEDAVIFIQFSIFGEREIGGNQEAVIVD